MCESRIDTHAMIHEILQIIFIKTNRNAEIFLFFFLISEI